LYFSDKESFRESRDISQGSILLDISKYTTVGKIRCRWQNYLIYWKEVNRNFYENAIKTNEQWFKALWDPWLRAGNPSQREKIRIE